MTSKKLSLSYIIDNGLPQNQVTVKELEEILSDMKMDLSNSDLFESHSVISGFRENTPLFNLVVYCALCIQENGIELPTSDTNSHVIDVYIDEDIETLNNLKDSMNKFNFSNYEYGGCDKSTVLSNQKGFDLVYICIHQGIEDREDEIMLLIEMVDNGESASCQVLKVSDCHDSGYVNPTSFHICSHKSAL